MTTTELEDLITIDTLVMLVMRVTPPIAVVRIAWLIGAGWWNDATGET
jgi:hypothetical protein